LFTETGSIANDSAVVLVALDELAFFDALASVVFAGYAGVAALAYAGGAASVYAGGASAAGVAGSSLFFACAKLCG